MMKICLNKWENLTALEKQILAAFKRLPSPEHTLKLSTQLQSFCQNTSIFFLAAFTENSYQNNCSRPGTGPCSSGNEATWSGAHCTGKSSIELREEKAGKAFPIPVVEAGWISPVMLSRWACGAERYHRCPLWGVHTAGQPGHFCCLSVPRLCSCPVLPPLILLCQREPWHPQLLLPGNCSALGFLSEPFLFV